MIKNYQDLQRLYMQLCISSQNLGAAIHSDDFKQKLISDIDKRADNILQADIQERIKDLKFEELKALKEIIKQSGKPKGPGRGKRSSNKRTTLDSAH